MSLSKDLRKTFFLILSVYCCWALNSLAVQADETLLLDTVFLKNGGVLHGTAKEITENKQKLFLVQTADGTLIKLKRSQVEQIRKPTDAMREYIQRKDTVPDTVDGHWQLQQWCVDNQRRDPKLQGRREFHLLRVVELEPDHEDARARLGHKEMNGVWVHWDHFMLNHGYVKDGRGVQRLPQAIAMHEREEAADMLVTEWNKKLKNLLTKIIKRNDQAALAEFRNIKDANAVPALMKVYETDSRLDAAARQQIIDILGQIESYASQNALVKIATTDGSLDLAERAVNALQQDHFDRDRIVGTVLHWLRPSASSTVNVNTQVNRAAWLIGRLEYQGATKELIEALVTEHTVPTGAASGNMSLGQSSDGIGFSPGKKKQTVVRPFQNRAVLDTLRLVTPGGVDFDYDEVAWMDWYIRANTPGAVLVGRDQ
ncbi:MAG: hypothetical protein GY819_09785 [Planctomycetaceae bacterium]|nr:hypothetical protein [Planctomycetaceae bacterium]MCP4463072.1 hypothetical protein [Planctomycetaceae bacterium]